MRAVDDGRQQQIQSKKESLEKERNEGQLFARKFLDEASEAIQRSALNVFKLRTKLKAYKLIVQIFTLVKCDFVTLFVVRRTRRSLGEM